jgi:hypothetical protein
MRKNITQLVFPDLDRLANGKVLRNPLKTSPFVLSLILGVLFAASVDIRAQTVVAWGDNSAGQTNVPAGLTNVTAISACGGGNFTLALTSSGSVVAWGANNHGQSTVPAGLSNVKAIAAGADHSLVLKNDGTMVAWGNNAQGEATIPAGLTNVVAIAAGVSRSMALKSDGTVVYWGDNSYGEVNINGLAGVKAIAAGFWQVMALQNDGTVVSYGDSIGSVPGGLIGVMAISSAWDYDLVLLTNGTMVVWGHDISSGLSVPSGLTNVAAIAAGDSYVLSLKNDGTVVAWGDNGTGEASIPAGLTCVTAIAAGDAHGVAIFGGNLSVNQQPQSETVAVGSTATLSVSASGAAPINYQWLYYSTNISGATNAVLTFTNAQLTNAGSYSVIVSNSLGFTNSTAAVLQVLPPDAPSIQVNGQLAVGTMVAVSNAQVTISGGFEDGYIFYTLDGSLPSVDSTLYSGAFTVTNSVAVQALSLSGDFLETAFAPTINVEIKTVYNLQTSVVGNGTITINPPSGPYLSNTMVTLTPIPGANWLFAYWTNGATGNQNPLSLTISGPQNVQAVFLPIPFYNLQTSVLGNGTIAINPASGPYLSNTVVTLTPIPSANWSFAYWTNGVTGNQNPLNLTMNSPQNVEAVFTPAYPVTVSTPGGGSVTVNGAVINPTTYYPAGSVLTLAATPNSGWSFLGWQGDAGGTNNPLIFTVNGPNNIVANFGTFVATNAVGSGQIVLNQPNPIPFGATLTVSAVPNAGKYFVTWSGAASGTNSPAQITVTSANPTVSGLFTTLPVGSVSLGVVVVGNGAVAISPQQNYYSAGTSVTLSAMPVPEATSFYGWAQAALGTNSPINVVMNSNQIVEADFGALPIVNISPLNQFVVAGSNAVLTATAAGITPLSYQWQNAQGVVVGATNATFTIGNAQATNSGDYSVVVSNSFGSVTSAMASVTVVFPPAISLQPTNQNVASGTSLTLTMLSSGTMPLYYQWQDSSGPIPSQTNSSLILNPALTNFSDSYSVIVSNPYGTATSQVARVLIYLPVSILIEPANLIVPYSAPATFWVSASSFPAPTSYQWMFNGTNLTGANTSTLTINSVRLANTGSYQVQVGNNYSYSTSQIASLIISPSITSPFSGASTIWGTSASISVGAIGTGTLSYQWYFNGVAVNGGTEPELNFSSIQPTNGGLYSVVVSSPYGSVTNVAAQVIVNPAGVSLGFYPGLTITGVAGYSYIIQSSTDLSNTNDWNTLTNLDLIQSQQLWIDTSVDAKSPFNSRVFYRVLPGQ